MSLAVVDLGGGRPPPVQPDNFISLLVHRPVASQPGVWGGSELGWVEHQAHPPPFGHCPRDVINLKNAPTLGHSQAPPFDIVRMTSSALRKIGKHPPLGHSQAPPPLDIARVTSSTYSKGGTKLLKGGTKLLKGGTKSLGWATGGGRPIPPRPPPPLATGLVHTPTTCLTWMDGRPPPFPTSWIRD